VEPPPASPASTAFGRVSSTSRRRPNRHSTSKPSSPSNHHGRRSRNGSLMTNRISIGATNPGKQNSLTPSGSTRVRCGNLRKSNWTMTGLCFSNTPEPELEGASLQETAADNFPTKSLGKAGWKAIFAPKDFSHEFGPYANPSCSAKRRTKRASAVEARPRSRWSRWQLLFPRPPVRPPAFPTTPTGGEIKL